jgi:hypothetical protein
MWFEEWTDSICLSNWLRIMDGRSREKTLAPNQIILCQDASRTSECSVDVQDLLEYVGCKLYAILCDQLCD